MANAPLTPEQLNSLNKELEQRILEANKDTTKTLWNKVLPDLMKADIFTVAEMSDRVDANGNKMLNIMMMTDKAGHKVIPLFTSPQRMQVLATPERKTFNVMKLNTVRFFESVKGKTTVLNPGSPLARLFNPFEMNLLAMENKDKIPPAPKAEAKPAEAPAEDSAE